MSKEDPYMGSEFVYLLPSVASFPLNSHSSNQIKSILIYIVSFTIKFVSMRFPESCGLTPDKQQLMTEASVYLSIFVLTALSPQRHLIGYKTEAVSLFACSRFKVFILQARLCRVRSSFCRKMTRKLRL